MFIDRDKDITDDVVWQLPSLRSTETTYTSDAISYYGDVLSLSYMIQLKSLEILLSSKYSK